MKISIGRGDTMSENDKCPKCKGEKILEEKKELDVKLDPGVPDKHIYNFPGEGHETVNNFQHNIATS